MKLLALALSLPLLAVCVALVPVKHRFEVSDRPSERAVLAAHRDPTPSDAVKLASSANGPFRFSGEDDGVLSIVRADGSLVASGVNVPADRSAHTTGLVFNAGKGFVIEQRGRSAPARFLFVSLDGRIFGWNPDVDPANAIECVDNGPEGAAFTSAALAIDAGAPTLYVANFANGTVDVFDKHFHEAGSFSDEHAPRGWSPFGIATIGNKLHVTFV
ncbi:MAG TPA: TIGR03118 family protein, partial [Planctomycetota bacterium]|nr:TIGR03118 family protein [Planctomycetota bacterium]